MPSLRRAFRPLVLIWIAATLVSAAALVRGNPTSPSPSATPQARFDTPHPDLPAHLERLGIDAWHHDGRLGSSVKVAVLDSGFRGLHEYLEGPLPGGVETRSFRADGQLEARDSQHGILCAEVVHSVAPGAELLLANWEPDEPESFLDAVRWAKLRGARVISCSVVMPGWSDGEGGGSVHKELKRILGDDVFFVASAGNLAMRHWAGRFTAGPGGWHEWARGRTDNPIVPWGSRTVSVECSSPVGSGSEYEIAVYDASNGERVGETVPLPASGFPGSALRFTPREKSSYVMRLRRKSGSGGPLRVVVLGASMRHHTSRGSVTFPGDGLDILAVGAVCKDGSREAYSSCGPNAGSVKPEVVAPVPFPSRWREDPFTGTSASAPQVAGLAALWLGRDPKLTPEQLRAVICRHCCDVGEPGRDCETGFGLVRLPELRDVHSPR